MIVPRGPGAAERPVRSFVAIELADPARTAVATYLESVRTIRGIAWTRAANLHVTLKFLGHVPPPRLARLAERLAPVVATTAAFDVAVRGLGAFPSLRRPRVLWVGLAAPELETLAGLVDEACAAEEFVREERPFQPHLTLGRVRPLARARGARERRRSGSRREREAADAGALAALSARFAADGDRDFGRSPAADVVLFRSDLGPAGARYTSLARFPLAGGPGVTSGA